MQKILVADDDPIIISLLQVLFANFEVVSAANGVEAIALYEQNHESIDLVLLDVQMPVKDGPETLAAIREINSSVPVYFMSGHTGRYSENQLLQMGATRLISKPFVSLMELAEVVREASK